MFPFKCYFSWYIYGLYNSIIFYRKEVKVNNLFPIGTVVRVGIGENLLMIITRLPLTIKDGQKGDYDYSACIYPIGVNANNEQYFLITKTLLK